MTGQDTMEVVLTPVQRCRLGQVSRVVLSWRRKRINMAEKPSQHKSMEVSTQSEQIKFRSRRLDRK